MSTNHDLFSRTTSFDIPGTSTSPGVHVLVTEGKSGGLDFAVDVLSTAKLTGDLRGLFFNFNAAAKLDGLSAQGKWVTDFDTKDVIDLGNGANMHGAASPFDVGVEFGTEGKAKDDIHSATFSLSGGTNPLTLDDISLVQFGARMTSVGAPLGARTDSSKLVAFAPAAPDANDDHYTIFEDGAPGLSSPTHTPVGTLFEILANDTDKDVGDKLSITKVVGAEHGIVTIVDGADADSLPGDAILYTPNADYSGTDSFTYAISDTHGGTDFADVFVNVTAVADAPTLTYAILAGSVVNEVVVRVTATQTDLDGSEFIDRIELNGIPAGVTVSENGFNPGTQPGQIIKDFVLTLPSEMDTSFALGVTAVAKEISNGDEQTSHTTAAILYDYTDNVSTETFAVTDQSMWGPGDAFAFEDDRFLGVQGGFHGSEGDTIYFNYDVDYKLGLQSTLTVGGGDVDASAPYHVDVETLYNKTTDWLHFDTVDALDIAGASFATHSPLLTYTLDLIAQIHASLTVGADISFGGFSVDLGPLGSFDFGGSYTKTFDLDASTNIVTIDQNTKLDIPIPDTGLTLTVSVPYIETTSHVAGDHLASSGSSNFLSLAADIDAIAGLIASEGEYDGGLTYSGSFAGIVDYSMTLLNYVLTGAMGVGQDFNMTFGQMHGIATFEDGFHQDFILGQSFDMKNASSHDTNQDGHLPYAVNLKPDATFSSDLSLTLSLSHLLEVIEASVYVHIPDPFPNVGGSIGPVYSVDDVLASTSIPIVGIPDFSFNLGNHDIHAIA